MSLAPVLDLKGAGKNSSTTSLSSLSPRYFFRRIEGSDAGHRTVQPLVVLTDHVKRSNSTKSNIRLSIGDPTVDGNITCPDNVVDELVKVVRSEDYNGYPPSSGYDESRKVVAEYMRRFCSSKMTKRAIRWEQVIITSGVSHGIVLALSGLCNPGDNVLVGVPSFPHYKTVCDSYGIECRYYPLNADNHWECDLEAADKLVDNRTRAFVIINPSNPCGSNFSRSHVEEIIGFCNRHQLPLISDEIYAELVFSGETFTSVADFDTAVPRLVLNGTAKFQAVPGWRVGWCVLIDPAYAASRFFTALVNMTALVGGVNSLCQEAMTRSLLSTPSAFLQEYISNLELGAHTYMKLLERKIGLSFDVPCASMFVMVRIDFTVFKDIENDMQFCEQLLDEENVQVLPGSIFGASGFFRATVSRPVDIIEDAVERIVEFCSRHAVE